MKQDDKQAYDRGLTLFSPDGRILQVEYAREAVRRGSPAIGVKTSDGVVLAAHTGPSSELIESESIEKIHRVDSHIGIATAGHVADGRKLVDYARKQAQHERLRYGESLNLDALTNMITDHIQEFTQVGGRRPFGTALVVGGVDSTGSHLFHVDPSGTSSEWKAIAIGNKTDRAKEILENRYEQEFTFSDGVGLVVETLGEICDEQVNEETLDVAAIQSDNEEFKNISVNSYVNTGENQ